MNVAAALDELAQSYLALHVAKEDCFWESKMGLASDAVDASRRAAEAEKAWNGFLQDPARLDALRTLEAGADSDADRRIARGWIAMLAAHVVEDPEGRKLSAELVELEGEIGRVRGEMELGYVDPDTGALVRASSNRLGLLMRTHPDARVRRAAFEGLASIERFVLANGFLDIVKKRNRLARLLGYEDYYDYRVQVVERMSKRRLFEVLDDLARRTEAASRTSLEAFAERHGAGALDPWSFGWLRAGKLTEKLDPYFRFGLALGQWGQSFHALGVRYRGATLTLDLVDRAGKYENGFMHGPEPAWNDRGSWRPARVNFTANAVVGQIGAGHRALTTLFHEGGHAAHFANIAEGAPCFSQEFAPTSVAYAEAQSMFMDSLVADGAFRTRYAMDAAGNAMPVELVAEAIREQQPFLAWEQRALLTVPFAERVLYELPDDELTPDRVVEAFRDVEQRLQGLSAGVRPVLAVPHLLAGEASAYYHGYVLAGMAVQQMRHAFLARDGHLVDNPRVGPALAEHIWAPGNAKTFDEILAGFTGERLSADALVESCTRSTDEALADELAQIDRVHAVPRREGPVDLDATVRVIHGRELVASTEDGGFEAAASAFEAWIETLERETARG